MVLVIVTWGCVESIIILFVEGLTFVNIVTATVVTAIHFIITYLLFSFGRDVHFDE